MFDYVEFSGEYAPYDHAMLENMGRAIELFDHLSGMIKIEQESRAQLGLIDELGSQFLFTELAFISCQIISFGVNRMLDPFL